MMRNAEISFDDAFCRPRYLVLLLLVLAIPAQAMAQQSNDRPSFRRFAVGGGVQIGTAVCFDCDEPGTLGASAGFEVRLNDDFSIVTEGMKTRGYDVYSLEWDGVTYPSLIHDYFAFLEVKLRWEFGGWRHRPYLVVGGAVRWHKDTYYTYDSGVVDGRWTVNPNEVQIREDVDTRGAVLAGFGWSFKVGERFEIRPEADLAMSGGGSYARIGVTGWFNF